MDEILLETGAEFGVVAADEDDLDVVSALVQDFLDSLIDLASFFIIYYFSFHVYLINYHV